MPPPLTVLSLGKSYGGHLVLSDVGFELNEGEALAVIGENGAGKSTLAKVIAGVVQPDSGEIQVRGQSVRLNSPRDAERAGIALIPQELVYLGELSVAENVCVGRYPGRFGLTSQKAMERYAATQLARYGVDVDPSARMKRLKVATIQLVEIVRALAMDAPIILLDEPTAMLNDTESAELHRALRRLTAQGVCVLYISHRMDEVYSFSDRVLVLRNGRTAAVVETRSTTPKQLVTYMLGRETDVSVTSKSPTGSRPMLALIDWKRSRFPLLDGLSLSVSGGEVVSLFGRRGSGHEIVADGLAGRYRDIDGSVVVDGRQGPVFRSPVAARRAGVGYVPAERKTEGLVLIHSVASNLTLAVLPKLSKLGVVSRRRERRKAADLAHDYDVRFKSLRQSVASLSGGNQQKVLLASRLAVAPKVMVMHEPTRGVDVGARVAIHSLIRSVAAQGAAVMVVTSDVEEAVNVSDRVLVMLDGRVAAELQGENKTQARALSVAGRVA